MALDKLQDRLYANRIPLLLCGPLLRRVNEYSVTVWVALLKKGKVTLEVLDPDGNSFVPPMKASRDTVDVGANLHIVAVTVYRYDPKLFEGLVYTYDISFDVDGQHYDLAAASNKPVDAFAYAPYKKPSFSLPPSDLTKLRLMHGSCRKPNAEGPDALAYLDSLIAEYPDQADARPHQLLLTGDQIYADEVAETLLLMLTDAGDTLLGWSPNEMLPPVGRFHAATAAGIPPGTRMGRLQEAKFTSDDTRSHLMSLGEYLAMYLFVWSDELWPVDIPHSSDVAAKIGVNVEDLTFAGEITPNRLRVDSFRKTLPQVRKVLANIPTYMICDDHEITDDWNLSKDFCNGVYGNDLGVRIVQNGLVAFALSQAWGNTPMQFDPSISPTPAGAQLLNLLPSYVSNSTQIQKIVGIHNPFRLATHSPSYAVYHDDGLPIQAEGYSFNDTSLYFHYSIEGPSHQIIVTDTRTWRAFYGGGGDHSDLLPPDQLIKQIGGAPPLNNRQLMVVITTNLPPIGPIRYAATVTHWLTHENDFLDSWELPALYSDHFIVKLSDAIKIANSTGTIRGSVVLLSGDVHHSFATRMNYFADIRVDDPTYPQPVQMVFAQLISSALHNQNKKTTILHKEGYESTAGAPNLGMMPKNVLEAYAGWNWKAISGGNSNAPPFLVGKEHRISAGLQTRDLYVDAKTATYRLVQPNDNVYDGLTGGLIYQVTLSQPAHFTYMLRYLSPAKTDSMPSSPTLGGSSRLADNRTAMDAYRKYDKAANGRHIIGLNNIAEVTFEGDPHKPTAVHHTVRWQDPKWGLQWARYDLSLDPTVT